MVDSPESIEENVIRRCPYRNVCTVENYGAGEICTSQDYELCPSYESMKKIYTEVE